MSRSLVAPSRQPCSLISLSCLVRHSWGARRGLQTPTHAAVASRQFLHLDIRSLGTCSLEYSSNLSSSKYNNRRPPRYKDPVHAGPAMVRTTVQRYPLAQHSHSTRYHDPSKSSSSSYNGSYSWTNGASAIFRFTGSAHSLKLHLKRESETGACTGIGINITGPTSPDQALRMILLNNTSMGTCGPETPEREPPTSFFLKNLDYGDHIVEVRHVDTRPNRTLSIDTFWLVVPLEQQRAALTEADSNLVIIA